MTGLGAGDLGAVGLTVGLTVGLAVGLTVGLTVGLPVGLTVGLMVGLPVGLNVGLAVGLTEGFCAGLGVGCRQRNRNYTQGKKSREANFFETRDVHNAVGIGWKHKLLCGQTTLLVGLFPRFGLRRSRRV